MIKREKMPKCFILEIEITSTDWDFKVGDIAEVPIIAFTKERAIILAEDRFCGSHFPSWHIKSVREIGNTPFFHLLITKNSLNKLSSR